MRQLIQGLILGLGISSAIQASSGWAQPPAPTHYQVSFWWVAKSNSVNVYYYQDDIMRCTLFQQDSNGMAPVCFDRRVAP